MAQAGEQSVFQSMSRVRTQLARRFRQIPQLLRTEGLTAVSDRIRRVAAQRIMPARAISPVRRADIMAVDLLRPFECSIPSSDPGQPLIANWVITPPALGSGGHTTLFRMVRYLEAHGYRNRIYFYDPYGGDHLYYESIVRNYYHFHGPVASVDQGMEDAHIVFATSWPTAYPVFNSRCAGKRFYFVQDFEPFFYPVGSISSLAENTYRMGFHGISIGNCFAEKLTNEFGMTIDTFNYGCDLSQYHRSPDSPRSGVVFYARRDNARRGLELGLMALELFAARNPGIEIHIYGDTIGKQPFSFTDHGRLTPGELNLLYNRCYAGLSLSFTNVSLVALEMLAAGCIPVVNDVPQVRTDLDNPFVAYAPPYPQALSAQLEAVLATQDFDFLSSAAAASVHATTWEEAGVEVDRILRRAMRIPAERSKIVQ
jgi:glycosyltransferase involved in cell wall biosynthesis